MNPARQYGLQTTRSYSRVSMQNVMLAQEEEVQHGEAQQVAAQQHRAQWELDVVEKARLARMTDEVDAFREQIVTRRAEEFRALKVCFGISLFHSNDVFLAFAGSQGGALKQE